MEIPKPSHMSLKRLAGELGMDRSACRRWMLKQGIEPVRRRTGDSGFQITLTVTMEQAAKLKQIRVEEGYLPGSDKIPENDLAGYSDDQLISELRRRISEKGERDAR